MRRNADPWRIELVKLGLWVDFIAYKKGLRSEGMTSQESQDAAVVEFEKRILDRTSRDLPPTPPVVVGVGEGETLSPAPAFVPPVVLVKNAVKVGSFNPTIPPKPKALLEKKSFVEGSDAAAKVRIRKAKAKEAENLASLVSAVPVEDLDGFLSKNAGVLESVSWVAKNLENKDVKASLAPSAEAWGMLLSYRRTKERRDEFWDKVFVKLIPSRSQLETKVKPRVDGAELISSIDEILEMRNRAERIG